MSTRDSLSLKRRLPWLVAALGTASSLQAGAEGLTMGHGHFTRTNVDTDYRRDLLAYFQQAVAF